MLMDIFDLIDPLAKEKAQEVLLKGNVNNQSFGKVPHVVAAIIAAKTGKDEFKAIRE